MQVQLPDGSIGEFPDDMPQEQIEGVLKQQFPSDPQTVPDNQSVPESQFQQPVAYPVQTDENSPSWMQGMTNPNFENTKIQNPGFMKTLDMLNTGVHRGVTHFTLGLMSMIPLGKEYQNKLKKYDADIESAQQQNINKYSSAAPVIGEIGGELLATAPAGGLLGSVSKGANALAEVAPTGLKTLARYGTSGIGGAGILSGTSALEYQGDAFDPSKAANKFLQEMSNPASYVAPMAGQALGRYLDKSRSLQKVTDEGIDVLPRDLKEKGIGKTISNLAYDSFSTLTPLGRRAEQLQNIGSSIGNVIKKIAGSPEAMSTDDYIGYASKNLQMGLKKQQAKGTLLWENGGFKTAQVNNLDELMPFIEDAKNIINRVKLPTYGQTSALLEENLLNKGKITFEDVKNIGSILGDAATDAYNLGAGTGANIGSKLSEIRRNLLEKATGNLTADQLKAYKTAQAFTKSQYELEDAIPLVKGAIADQIQANKIVTGILKDGANFDKNVAMGIMSEKGQAAVKAAKIAEALSQSSGPNGVNLNSFLKSVAEGKTASETSLSASATKSLLGDEYKHIEGLSKHLIAINEAKKIGSAGKFMIPLMGAGAVAGLGATDNLNMDTVKSMVPYAAMLFAANNPILKRLLGASTRKLSDSTYNHLNNKISEIFTRAGYLYNEDGSMSKQENK